MKLISLLLLAALFSREAVAVDFLTKGTPATQDGYLFSVAEEQHLRLLTQDDIYEKALIHQLTNQNVVLQANATIEEQRITNLQTGLDTETKLALDAQNSSTLRNVLYFSAGILAGFLSVYAASKAFYHN
jgi:hypothetical protein